MSEAVLNESATAQVVNEIASDKGVTKSGQPRQRAPKVDYPFKRMEIGAVETVQGDRRIIKDALRAHKKYSETKAFTVENTPVGVRVTRTA